MQRLTQPKVLFQTTKHSLHRLSKYSKNTGIDEEMDDELPTDDGEVKLDELKVYKFILYIIQYD